MSDSEQEYFNEDDMIYDDEDMFDPSTRFPTSTFPASMRSFPLDAMRAFRPPIFQRGFEENYRVYSMDAHPTRQDASRLNHVILPQSALAKLTSLHIMYPMLFSLTPMDSLLDVSALDPETIDPLAPPLVTHAGVLEFTAEEGRVYLPRPLLTRLKLTSGVSILRVRSTTLPLGTFIKIQPQDTAFLDITDPRAVLERAMRDFAALTIGDIFSFEYNQRVYEVRVLEVKPRTKGNAGGVCVIETDLQVDFAAPVGYVEPEKPSMGSSGSAVKTTNVPGLKEKEGWSAFGGSGQRLSGKALPVGSSIGGSSSAFPRGDSKSATKSEKGHGIVPAVLDVPWNKLYFGYAYIPPAEAAAGESSSKEKSEAVTAFKGDGKALRDAKKKETRK